MPTENTLGAEGQRKQGTVIRPFKLFSLKLSKCFLNVLLNVLLTFSTSYGCVPQSDSALCVTVLQIGCLMSSLSSFITYTGFPAHLSPAAHALSPLNTLQGYGDKHITLYDIRAELSCRYKDLRTPYRSPNTEEVFNMLTKETPETFYIGTSPFTPLASVLLS